MPQRWLLREIAAFGDQIDQHHVPRDVDNNKPNESSQTPTSTLSTGEKYATGEKQCWESRHNSTTVEFEQVARETHRTQDSTEGSSTAPPHEPARQVPPKGQAQDTPRRTACLDTVEAMVQLLSEPVALEEIAAAAGLNLVDIENAMQLKDRY